MKKIFYYDIPLDSGSQLLPLDINFNFGPFIKHMDSVLQDGTMRISDGYTKTLKRIKEEGVLTKPFPDLSFVMNHLDDIEELMQPVFPEILTNNEIKGIILPFAECIFNPTARLTKILQSAGDKSNIQFEVDESANPYIGACIMILNMMYGAGIDFAKLYHFKIKDQETGITRYFRSLINADFARLVPTPEAPSLTPDEIELLKSNLNDVDLWMEKIPPKSYVFEGVGILNLLDVTRERQESMIKNLLLKNDVLDDPSLIEELIELLGSYLLVPDLNIGLVAYDDDTDITKPLGFGLWQSILLKDDEEACSFQQ
ncbi:MAG: hypothetical protein HKN68_20470, partial [Saprospiraceae bacterium]|nr:hypothetical protein [Saprospiraceae bacterium]